MAMLRIPCTMRTLTILLAVTHFLPRIGVTDEPRAPFRIVGYLPDYRFPAFNAEHAADLTDLILFSAEPTADGGIDMSKFRPDVLPRFREFKTKQQIRLILCVGGWGRSSPFPTIVSSDDLRSRFVANAVEVCLQNRFDGIDLDWEHPENDAQHEAYGLLLRDLKAAFKEHGLTVSVTIAPWQRLTSTAIEAVDWVQLMSYDYGQRHSTLEQARQDGAKFVEQGVPPEKIVLGMPFYGRDIQDRTKATTYAELSRRFKLRPETDEIAGTFFNGPDTIRRKTRFALDSGFGGVMVWEIGQDRHDEKSLLRVVSEAVKSANE